jgi:hypothetical protein
MRAAIDTGDVPARRCSWPQHRLVERPLTQLVGLSLTLMLQVPWNPYSSQPGQQPGRA